MLAVSPTDQLLYLINPDGSSRRTLLGVSPSGSAPGYATWSPDGREIAVARGRPCDRVVCDASLYVFSIATHKLRKVARDVAGISPPAWSPDGRRIAFTNARDGRLHLTSLSGRDVSLHVPIPGVMAYPSWAPGARRLSFSMFGGKPGSYAIAVGRAQPASHPARRRRDRGLVTRRPPPRLLTRLLER